MSHVFPSRRKNILWLAAFVHRISGVALATFLPLHFLVLGLAINAESKLDDFLRWSDQPIVKFAESGLVFVMVVHLLGGLRLLLVENFTWRNGQARLATAAAGVSMVVAFVFLVRAL